MDQMRTANQTSRLIKLLIGYPNHHSDSSAKRWYLIFLKFLSTTISQKLLGRFGCRWEFSNNVWVQIMPIPPPEGTVWLITCAPSVSCLPTLRCFQSSRGISIFWFSLSHNCSRIAILNTLIIGRPRRHRVSQMTRNDDTVPGYNNLRTVTIRIFRNDIVNVFSFVLCTCRLWWYQATLKCPEESITAEWAHYKALSTLTKRHW